MDELGRAKHICLSHCRAFFKCQQIETPLVSGLRAGILWNSYEEHSGFQPVEMICSDCVDEGVKRCKHCGHSLKGKQRKYCSRECSAVVSGRKQAVKEARKKQLPEPYVIVEM